MFTVFPLPPDFRFRVPYRKSPNYPYVTLFPFPADGDIQIAPGPSFFPRSPLHREPAIEDCGLALPRTKFPPPPPLTLSKR